MLGPKTAIIATVSITAIAFSLFSYYDAFIVVATITVILFSLYPSFVSYFGYVDPFVIAKKELQLKKERGVFRKFPLISLIVAVKNEENFISDCVSSMINQTYKNKEIIVVNDGSDDGTQDILNQNFGDNLSVKILHLEKNVGKKRAIAEALRIAKGEFFAFTDSDSIWKENAIARCMAIFENDSKVGAICGHCNVQNAEDNILTRIQDSRYEKQFRVRKGFESIFGSVSCVSGPLACYRRSAVYNYIPAWENDTFLGSDFKFATDRVMTGFVLGGQYIGKNLKQKYKDDYFVTSENYPCINWKVVYSKSARAWTRVPNNLSDLFIQRIRWNKSFIRNIFHTGKFYWRNSFSSSLYYYFHIFYVFALPFSILAVATFLLYSHPIEHLGMFIAALVGVSALMSYMSHGLFRNDWFHNPTPGTILALVTPWLIFYSLLTIQNRTWIREGGNN